MLSLDEAPARLTPTDRINNVTWNKQKNNSQESSPRTARNTDALHQKSPPAGD